MTAKKKKSKAEKRINRMRSSENAVSTLATLLPSSMMEPEMWSDGEPEDWQPAATKAFVRYVEIICAEIQIDSDTKSSNRLEARKKIYSLAQVAWNISTDSDSREETLTRLADTPLPVSKEQVADIRDLLNLMIEIKWKLFSEFLTYVDDIEFTRLPNGQHDLAIGMSVRADDGVQG